MERLNARLSRQGGLVLYRRLIPIIIELKLYFELKETTIKYHP